MSKELEALETIKNAPTIYVGLVSDINTRHTLECKTIEKALIDYAQIKEIAKHYHWEDLANDVFKVETDRKWQLKFESAIVQIQEDYQKARVLDELKKLEFIDFGIDTYGCYIVANGIGIRVPKETYDLIKKVML